MTMSGSNADTMPETFPMADDLGEDIPDYTCLECLAAGVTRTMGGPAALGAHRKSVHGIEGAKRNKKKDAPKADTGPVNVNLNVGAKKTGKAGVDMAKTAKGATSFANFVAVGLLSVGLSEDAGPIAAHAETWGQAVGDLSQYQPWLQKVFAPTGEMSGHAMAWAALLAVTAAMAMPIAVNHGLVQADTAAKFGVMAGAGASVAASHATDNSPPT